MITAAHVLQELSSENNTFGAAVENLHRAEKTASKDNLAFQKIVACVPRPKSFFAFEFMKDKHNKLLNKNALGLINGLPSEMSAGHTK